MADGAKRDHFGLGQRKGKKRVPGVHVTLPRTHRLLQRAQWWTSDGEKTVDWALELEAVERRPKNKVGKLFYRHRAKLVGKGSMSADKMRGRRARFPWRKRPSGGAKGAQVREAKKERKRGERGSCPSHFDRKGRRGGRALPPGFGSLRRGAAEAVVATAVMANRELDGRFSAERGQGGRRRLL